MTVKGVSAAIKEAAGREDGDGELGDDEQAELFASFEAGEDAIKGGEVRAWSGRGRKPGSRNVNTAGVVDYILKTKRHPLVALASVVSMTPGEVARHFGVSDKEAARLWLKACDSLAPYVASKMPQTIALDAGEGFAPITLVFGEGERAGPAIRGGERGDPAELAQYGPPKQNQALSGDDPAKVAQVEGRTINASD